MYICGGAWLRLGGATSLSVRAPVSVPAPATTNLTTRWLELYECVVELGATSTAASATTSAPVSPTYATSNVSLKTSDEGAKTMAGLASSSWGGNDRRVRVASLGWLGCQGGRGLQNIHCCLSSGHTACSSSTMLSEEC
eukprot:365292-Chlamydomonas_euryale.AAC.1